jgi:hypothetical protein
MIVPPGYSARSELLMKRRTKRLQCDAVGPIMEGFNIFLHRNNNGSIQRSGHKV